MLLVLTGLAQKFMENKLNIDISKPAKGVILEIKEEKGFGKTMDVIIYDGKIKRDDEIIIAGIDKPIITRVRNLLEQSIKNRKLVQVDEVTAACTVKIIPKDTEEIFAGMPFEVADKNNEEKIKKEIQREVEDVLIETDHEGVIIKADSLGSLEALTSLLKENKILIKKASLGSINKSDIAEASAEENPLYKTILAFNVKALETNSVKIINHDVIYKIIDDYRIWKENETRKTEQEKLKNVVRPGKIMILPGTVFRQSNPAIVGVEILGGILKPNTPIMKDKYLTDIKGIQLEGKNIEQAEKGKQVAISMPNITAGRQINEEDMLYTDLKESDFRTLKKLKKYLNGDEIEILKEISEIKRKENPMWGV